MNTKKKIINFKILFYKIIKKIKQIKNNKYLVANRQVNRKSLKKNNCERNSLVLANCFIRLYNNGFKSFIWNNGSDVIWSNNLYEKFDTGYLNGKTINNRNI